MILGNQKKTFIFKEDQNREKDKIHNYSTKTIIFRGERCYLGGVEDIFYQKIPGY